MGQDKRERHRLERAREKARRARHAARLSEQLARRERAVDAALEAERELRAGDANSAVAGARRAAELAPGNEQIAVLYVRAAEKTRDPRQRIRAYEHLRRLIDADPVLLILLAQCYAAVGELDRASPVAAAARRILPRRIKDRRRWLAILEGVESRVAAGAGRAVAEPETLSLFAARVAYPPPAKQPPLEPVAAAAERRADEPAIAPGPPALPPQLRIPVALPADIDGLDTLARAGWDSPDDVRLAVLAARIRDAGSFDVLLAVERARGLMRLSYQEETARKVLSVLLGRALLADEVGLGKTVEAGLVLSEYLLRGRVERALILTPPSLVAQWRGELASKFAITCRSSEDAALRGDPRAFWSGPGVVVASLATARTPQHRELAAAEPWDLLIVDEAHALKNARTQSYALVSRLTSRFLLLLTATPIENEVEELYNLVSLIRPGHLGGRTEFVRRFGARGGRAGETVRREVRALLGEVMVRNTRALSGVRLPPRFARTVLVAPTAAEGELYHALLDALRAIGPGGRTRLLLSTLLQEAGSSPHAARATLEKIAADTEQPAAVREALAPAIGCAARLADTGKGQALVRVLEGDTGPAIVFTRFRATLGFLTGVLASRGIACERVDGALPAAARHQAIDRCRERGAVLLSTDIGSEGLNLQFCHRLVNFDLPWNPMRIEQRIGRLHRIGQEHAVEVITLCLAGSIEERILRILDERINLFELIVGEVEMILGYLDADADFAGLVLDAFAAPEAERREHDLARLGDALAAARQRYGRVKSYDEEFFRNELGV